MPGLSPRVRHGRHPAARVPFGDEQGQRAPAAAEVEHFHAVFEAGARAGERQHRLLGRGKVSDPLRPQAAAVLEPRPEELAEEGGRQLVVLLVRGFLVDDERAGGEGGGVAAQRRRVVAGGRALRAARVAPRAAGGRCGAAARRARGARQGRHAASAAAPRSRWDGRLVRHRRLIVLPTTRGGGTVSHHGRLSARGASPGPKEGTGGRPRPGWPAGRDEAPRGSRPGRRAPGPR